MRKRHSYKKILIVKPSSLGDVVHSLPFLNALRNCFPSAEIHWVIAKGLEGLLEGNPMIGKLIVIHKDMWKNLSKTGSTLKEIRKLYRELRNEGYDLVVDLQGLLRSGLITLATGAPARIGFAEAREGSRLFYTEKVKGGRDVHAVDRYMRVAMALGCGRGDIVFPFPLFNDDLRGIRSLKKELGDYAIVVPGARWKTKIWPAENFGRVAAMLPFRTVVVGSRADARIAEKIVATSGGKAVSLAGRTNLRELIDIMRDARIVISNDSGPVHIAAALKIPVAAIFGPTSPVRTGPYGEGHAVLRSPADCSPCFKKRCSDMRCMKGITPDAVYEQVLLLLQKRVG